MLAEGEPMLAEGEPMLAEGEPTLANYDSPNTTNTKIVLPLVRIYLTY
jgi:hypothetical protein